MENNYNTYNGQSQGSQFQGGQPQGNQFQGGQPQGMGGMPYQNPRPQNSGGVHYAAIAAVAAAVYTLIAMIIVWVRWRGIVINSTTLFGYLLPLGLFVAIAVLLFLKQEPMIPGILFCVLAGGGFIYGLFCIPYIRYNAMLFVSRIVFAAVWALLGIWALFAATAKENGFAKFLKKYWYIPAAVCLLGRMMEMFWQIQRYKRLLGWTYTFGQFLGWLLGAAIYSLLAILVARWIMNPEELTLQTSGSRGFRGNPGYSGQNPYQSNPGYAPPQPGYPHYQGYPGQNPNPNAQGYPGQNPNPNAQGYSGQNGQSYQGQNPIQNAQGYSNQNTQDYPDYNINPGSQEPSNQNESGQNAESVASETCPQCGQPIAADDKFCTYCGYKRG